MSASTPPSGRIVTENELLARLGLPPSATAEDVDQLHRAASQFLAAAPSGIRGWARAQASLLDEAYLQLTDPVGLEGSALMSPTRPPTVVPGGPATPPARRGPVSASDAILGVETAAEVAPETADPEPVGATPNDEGAEAGPDAIDDTDTDDLDALYASVTPGAHRDLVSGGRPDRETASPAAPQPHKPAERRDPRGGKALRAAAPAPAVTAPASSGPWKAVAIAVSALLVVVVVVGFVVPAVFNLGGAAAGTASAASAAPSASGPTVDMAQITSLMTQLQAKPNDIATMQAIGDTYFTGADYTDAASFYSKILAIDPQNIKALLASGAAAYNQQDTATAERNWKQVVALKPTDKALAQEVHYDLGILYMHATNPDWTSVISEWQQVLAIDPTSAYAQNVQQYVTIIAGSSMVPASLLPAFNGLASPLPSAAPSGSAAVSSAAPASVAPSGSAAPAAVPSPSAAGTVITETAKNQSFATETLTAPANTAFTIRFENQDAGLPHDMLIKDSTGTTVFKGDMVTGPASIDYHVPALSAGTYTFTCSIYPATMNGTLVVGN